MFCVIASRRTLSEKRPTALAHTMIITLTHSRFSVTGCDNWELGETLDADGGYADESNGENPSHPFWQTGIRMLIFARFRISNRQAFLSAGRLYGDDDGGWWWVMMGDGDNALDISFLSSIFSSFCTLYCDCFLVDPHSSLLCDVILESNDTTTA